MTSGEAGNTVETLKPVPVEVAAAQIAGDKPGLPSAADLDAVEAEKNLAAGIEPADEEIDAEAEFYVTRAEYNELLARIAKYNVGAPHKL